MKQPCRRSLLLAVQLMTITLTMAPQAAAEGFEAFTYRGSFSWLNAAVFTKVRPSPLNPENTMLQLPSWTLVSELRPDLRLEHPGLQFILRPRVRSDYSQAELGGEKRVPTGSSRAKINEGYLQWNFAPDLYFAYGLQSYQWGPAESLNPSNQIFHETVLQRDILYEVAGKYIARLNYSPRGNLSIVLMSEYAENKELAPFQADTTFASKSLVKAEVSWAGGASYAGMVWGGRERSRPWVGEYLSLALPFADGWSIYGDAAHERGSQAYYPVTSLRDGAADPSPSIQLAKSKSQASKITTLATIGLRYDFENGTIVRGEYILNEAGYSKQERQVVVSHLSNGALLASASDPTLAGRLSAPGLVLPGQRYLYASVYLPDLFGLKDLATTGRLLYAATDASLNSYCAFEYAVGDAGTVLVASSFNRGDSTSELGQASTHSHFVGYRHVW